MKFTKYNNPKKKCKARYSPYSQQYISERRDEMYQLLAKAETESQRDAIIKAFDITIHP